MKRAPGIAFAVAVGAMSVEHKPEPTSCKDGPCTVESNAIMPEQLHTSEQVPENVLAEDQYVEIPSSPVTYAKKGSEEHREGEAKSGMKARDVTDPKTLAWLRERELQIAEIS